ncbi:hypothetical protein GCM10010522_31510 [Kribbella solani]
MLSPQPGARDYVYLTNPPAAEEAAARLGLQIADERTMADIAQRWKETSTVSPEDAMRDYTQALMPELAFEDLARARTAIRDHAKSCGVVIGE